MTGFGGGMEVTLVKPHWKRQCVMVIDLLIDSNVGCLMVIGAIEMLLGRELRMEFKARRTAIRLDTR